MIHERIITQGNCFFIGGKIDWLSNFEDIFRANVSKVRLEFELLFKFFLRLNLYSKKKDLVVSIFLVSHQFMHRVG